MGSHLIDGEFQSDKYPTTPRGKVPLSVKDKNAQDLLWKYAQRRRSVDAEFSDDLEAALTKAGYIPEQVDPEITRAITTYFQSLNVGDTLVVEQLKRAIVSVAGIFDFSLLTPTTNVSCSYKQLAIVGPTTITLRPE